MRIGAGRAIVLFAMMLLSILPGASLDRRPRAPSPDIVILIDPLQKSEELEPFRQFLADAAVYKLEKAGLEPQIAVGSPDADLRPQPRAAAVGAAAALVCRYQVQGQEMAVTLGWYDTQASAASASVEARGEVDLHLDGVIFGVLDEILGKMQDRVRALAARRVAEAPVELAPGQNQDKPPVLEPAQVPQRGSLPGSQPGSLPGSQPGPAPEEKRTSQPSSLRVLVAGGFAPFLPTGAAAYYFGVGYLPSLLVSFLIPTPAGSMGIGLFTGVDYFAASGLTDTSDNYLVPVGVDVRYELDVGFLRPFFHIAGGPALLIMVTGTQGTITDVIPFFRSGIGVELTVTPWLGINTVVDYDIFFEMPYLLMGFSPSVNVAVRL